MALMAVLLRGTPLRPEKDRPTKNPALAAAAAAAAYNGRVNDAIAAATTNGSMIRDRVTRELVKTQARESNVSNLLAAIVAGLNEGIEDAGAAPHAAFYKMAKAEIESAMRRISMNHPNRAAN